VVSACVSVSGTSVTVLLFVPDDVFVPDDAEVFGVLDDVEGVIFVELLLLFDVVVFGDEFVFHVVEEELLTLEFVVELLELVVVVPATFFGVYETQ